MSRLARILLNIVIISIVLILTTATSKAEIKSRFNISLGGGYGYFNMRNLNDKYVFTPIFGMPDDGIRVSFNIPDGYMILGELTMKVRKSFYLGMGLNYLRGNDSENIVSTFMDDYRSRKRGYECYFSASALIMYINGRYYLPVSWDNFYIGMNIGKCFGRVDISWRSITACYGRKSTTDGYFGAEGLALYWLIGKSFHVNAGLFSYLDLVIGYRYIKTDNMRYSLQNDRAYQENFTMRALSNYYLDFSGIYFAAGVTLFD
jgi:hypothetical protein